ncbi:MAG: protein kinase [Myxococcales bacterium]
MTQTLPEPSHVIADKYVVERSLGQGGMGAVYLVSHRVTGKKLALKCLLPQYLEYPELVERFLREAQAAGRIQHRHVVDVFDVGRDGQVLYIVMPYLEGKPLSALLREKAVELDEILALVLRAMEGVAAAHAQGIVHRDLKPDNIFVCKGPSGRLDDPRVLDFGISKLDDEEEKRSLTKSGVLMGTPHYMSFEQLNSQRDIDARADVYAMGCILYESMAGQLPYVADSAPALAIRMMSGPPKHLSALRPDLPEGLVNAVMKSIEKDRADRFPTLEAMIAALQEFVPNHVSTHASDEARMSRRLTRPDFIGRSSGEDKTLPAPTPAPKSSIDAKTVVTPTGTAQPQPPAQSAQPITLRTQPQLRLGNEPERAPNRATQNQPPLFRLGAITTFVLLGLGAGAWLWSHKGSSGSPAEASAQQPIAPAAAPATAPEENTAEPAPDSEGPKKTVVRKIRRKKVKPGTAAPVGAAYTPAGTPSAAAKPTSDISPEADAVMDEWEEVEETVVVNEGEHVEGEIISETPLPPAPKPSQVSAPEAKDPSAPAGEAPKADAPKAEAPAGEPTPAPAEPAAEAPAPPAAATP